MSEPLRFAVLTSSDVPAGMIVNYLLNTTHLNIGGIYVDTLADNSKKRPAETAGTSNPAGSKRQRILWHIALAFRLRRQYTWMLLNRITKRSQLELLLFCERISPRLFRKMCGVAFDPDLAAHGRLLYRLQEVATQHQIPIVYTGNINNIETVNALKELQPDVIIGLGTRILSRKILGTAKIGVLNGHSSLLPAYRGSATEFWQLVGGETRTGVTIHWMLANVDRGAICEQRSWDIPIGADHYLLRLMSQFYRLEPWRKTIQRLLNGEIPGDEQGPPPTPTFRKPTLKQEFEFYCHGIRPAEAEAEMPQPQAHA